MLSDAAMQEVHSISQGNPGAINALCDRVLEAAENAGKTEVGAEFVRGQVAMASAIAGLKGTDSGSVKTPTGQVQQLKKSAARSGDDSGLAPSLFPRKDSDVIVLDTGIKPREKSDGPALALKTGAKQPPSAATDRRLNIGKIPGEASRNKSPGTGIEAVVSFCSEYSEKLPAETGDTDGGDPPSVRQPAEQDINDPARVEATMPADKPGSRWARPAGLAAGLIGLLAVGLAVYEPGPVDPVMSQGELQPQAGGTDQTAFATPVPTTGSLTAAAVDEPRLAKIENVAAAATGPAGYPAADQRYTRVRSALGDVTDDPDALFRLAITMPGSDPEAALTAYSLAALGGHDRAAYYLGQKYELGEGVPRNLGVAQAWYELGAATISGAFNRYEALKGQPTSGSPKAPVPLFQRATASGELEMVWSVEAGAAVRDFTVEVADGNGTTLTTTPGLSVTALRQSFPDVAQKWRVGATSDEGRTEFSNWMPLR